MFTAPQEQLHLCFSAKAIAVLVRWLKDCQEPLIYRFCYLHFLTYIYIFHLVLQSQIVAALAMDHKGICKSCRSCKVASKLLEDMQVLTISLMQGLRMPFVRVYNSTSQYISYVRNVYKFQEGLNLNKESILPYG